MAVALALLLPSAAEAQSPDVCATIAKTVLVVDPPDGWRGPWQSPIRALGKASSGTISIDGQAWPSDKDQALDKLRQEYRAGPSLLAAISDLTDGRWAFSVHRFGGSSLLMAKVIEGSASCERFVFFDAPSGGAAHAIAPPPMVKDAEPFAFCYRTKAYAAAVAGVPAFVVETDGDSTVELSLTPWRGGEWQRDCRVTIDFSDMFEITHRFCKTVDCSDMAEKALALVRKIDLAAPPAAEATRQGAAFRAMKSLADKTPEAIRSLPTFGGTVDGSRDLEFAPDAVVLPLVVGGETYLARVGHYAVGWRVFADYLLAAYRLAGTSLEPVAGIYITKTRGKPLSATVD
jgi:hypothetical protein